MMLALYLFDCRCQLDEACFSVSWYSKLTNQLAFWISQTKLYNGRHAARCYGSFEGCSALATKVYIGYTNPISIINVRYCSSASCAIISRCLNPCIPANRFSFYTYVRVKRLDLWNAFIICCNCLNAVIIKHNLVQMRRAIAFLHSHCLRQRLSVIGNIMAIMELEDYVVVVAPNVEEMYRVFQNSPGISPRPHR